jgi:hypothetical protein
MYSVGIWGVLLIFFLTAALVCRGWEKWLTVAGGCLVFASSLCRCYLWTLPSLRTTLFSTHPSVHSVSLLFQPGTVVTSECSWRVGSKERLSPFAPRETSMTGPFLKSANRIQAEKWFCKIKCEVYKPLHWLAFSKSMFVPKLHTSVLWHVSVFMQWIILNWVYSYFKV